MRTSFLISGVALAVSAGCGDDGGSVPIDSRVIDAMLDASPDAPVTPVDAPDNRTKTITLTGGANALFWDASASTLYLTDNDADSLLAYTDADGIETVGTFPAASAGVSLGDMIKRNNGAIITPSFGFGTQGTLFSMATDGTSIALTGLDATRRRIALSVAGTTTYVGYFTGGGGNPQVGGVATVAFSGSGGGGGGGGGATMATETEIAGASTSAGFKKVVGLAATADAVYVTDQTDKKIYKIAIPGNAVTTLADVPNGADLLATMPNGDLLTGGGAGISRVTPTGTVSTILGGEFEAVRGIAYDNAAHRIFLINHSLTVGTPDKLEIRPLDN